MKIRIGFVTNSSSYGFSCVHIDNPVLQDILQKYYAKNTLLGSLEGMDRFLAFGSPEDQDGSSNHTFSDEKDDWLNYVPDSPASTLDFILDIINEASPGIMGGDGNMFGDFLDGEDRELFDLMEELKEEIRNNESQIMDAFDYVFFTSGTIRREGDNFKPGEVVSEEYEYSKELDTEFIKREHHQWKYEYEDNYWYDGAGFEQKELHLRFADFGSPFGHTYKLVSCEDAGGAGIGHVNNLDIAFIPREYSRSKIREIDCTGMASEREPYMASFPHFINWKLGDYPFWGEEPSPTGNSANNQKVFLRLMEEIRGKGSLLAFVEDDRQVGKADNQEKDDTTKQKIFQNDLIEDGMDVYFGLSQGLRSSEWEKYLGELDQTDFGPIEVFDKGLHLRFAAGSTYLWHNRFDYLFDYSLTKPWEFDEGSVNFSLRFHLNTKTIDEAILRLQKEAFPDVIKAIHFLFTPPENKETTNDLLTFDHPKVVSFFELLKRPFSWDIRVNALAIPDIHRYYHKNMPQIMEPCEGGRFSCYISPDLTLYPCKYIKDTRYSVSLLDRTLQEAWNSEPFQEFRKIILNHCTGKGKVDNCTCSCPLLEKR